MTSRDPEDADADRLAHASVAAGDPTGWFEQLYAEADQGAAIVPWDRGAANPMLVEWVQRQTRDPAGRTALVVGAGYGSDAAHLAGLGWRTTAFDVSPTAIAEAQRRFGSTGVRFAVADLLDPPPAWAGAFDLVLESYTVQALPLAWRERATAGVRGFVAPGGTLVVLAAARPDSDTDPTGPPWPLTRSELDGFAADGLQVVAVEELVAPSGARRWRAELTRDPALD